MKCKFEHDDDCCNSGSPQYMCKYKPGICGSAVPMANADRIRAMSDEELACFIKKLAYNREPPWGDLFQETFCKGCPAQEYTMENGQKMRLRECDFADGECPHGSDIAWWLQQPAEEGDRYAAD